MNDSISWLDHPMDHCIPAVPGIGIPFPKIDPKEFRITLPAIPESRTGANGNRPREPGRHPPKSAAAFQISIAADIPIEPPSRVFHGLVASAVRLGEAFHKLR